MRVRGIDPLRLQPSLPGRTDEEVGRASGILEVPTLHQHRAGSKGEDRIGGPAHLVAGLDGEAGETRGLRKVGRDDRRQRQDPGAERSHGVLCEQHVAVLGDEHRIDHEVGDGRLAHGCRDGFHDRRVREHPGLRRVHADVRRDRADLVGDRSGRDSLEALHAHRVLDGHRRDGGHPEDPEGREGLEIGLDACAPARVAPGDRERPRSCVRIGHAK